MILIIEPVNMHVRYVFTKDQDKCGRNMIKQMWSLERFLWIFFFTNLNQ